jgi:LmbE family N-acetylglucosaminyl deacetylase
VGLKAVNAGQALRAAESLPFSTLDERLGDGGLVVVAPHPDDESLACGGLIAQACAQGRKVRVVVVSDGTGSHPASRKYPRNRLRALREAEARAAISALGLAPRHAVFLRLPDRFVPSEGAAAEAGVEAIVACARAIGAKALFVSWRHDPHCDHQASYRLARVAQRRLAGVTLYEYTVWGSALSPNASVAPLIGGFRIRIARHRARKDRAIAAHRSQTTGLIDDDPRGFRLWAADLARFAKPYESFFVAAP